MLYSEKNFRKIVSSFDFVVPLASEVRDAVNRTLKDIGKRPVVIEPGWSRANLFREQTYRPVLESIRKALKEEKRK